jgi:site-specific DNA-methyltransferase (adenine-specific)
MELKDLIKQSYYYDNTGILLKGDCLEWMKLFPNNSIDMVLCDLPYGITANKWDSIIPLNHLWNEYHRIVKNNGAIILNCIEPFTTILMISNMTEYRHKWVWNKNNSAGFVTAKIRPFQICEDILVFGKNKVNYYPIMEERGKPRTKGGYSKSDNYGIEPSKSKSKSNLYYPKNLLEFSNAVQIGKLHPTQKPIELFEYLIETYSKESEIILDNSAGSCTTAIASKNLNRKWICIEKEEKYCEISKKRLENYQKI